VRLFRSKTFPYRFLAAPRFLLELPWYPAKRFLDFSERVDLFTRISDLFYFNEERTAGLFPKISLGGTGEGVGISLFHHDLFGKNHRINASYSLLSDDEYFFRSAYSVEPEESHPFHFKLEGEYTRDKDTEIFIRSDLAGHPILGMKTVPGDINSYALTRFRGRMTVGVKLASSLDLSFRLRGEAGRAGTGDESHSSLPQKLPGLDDKVNLIGGGGRLLWDLRNNPYRPFYGVLVQAEADALTATKKSHRGESFGFSQYTLDVQYYIPIYHPHRLLFLRHYLRRVDPLGDRKIPFYDLPILDLNRGLRSFERNRFQDRGVFSFNAEYRYPIWVTWDAFLFFDGGQVFNDFAGLKAKEFRFSQGMGIRFMSKEKLLFTLQFGHGREGDEIQISLGQVF